MSLEQLDELDAIQAHKSYQKDMFNPCGHSGFESAPCPVCGYPDPVSLISILRTENERMHKENLVLHSIRILIQRLEAEIVQLKAKKTQLISDMIKFQRKEANMEAEIAALKSQLSPLGKEEK